LAKLRWNFDTDVLSGLSSVAVSQILVYPPVKLKGFGDTRAPVAYNGSTGIKFASPIR
jgi:hypothetical protein